MPVPVRLRSTKKENLSPVYGMFFAVLAFVGFAFRISSLSLCRIDDEHNNPTNMTTTITENQSTTPDCTSETFSEIELRSIQHQGRNIDFSISPEIHGAGPPVLFFYPGGGNRRMLYSFRRLFSDIQFLCVNRPGKGGTSPAETSSAEAHITTAVQDATAVLDELGIDKVSLMCQCAGTPFCMTFAARYPERTTGNFIGISSWVQPADCGYSFTKLSFFLGTKVRPIAAPMVGMVFASIGSSLTSFPSSLTLKALRSKLSIDERKAFDEKFHDKDEFSKMMKWMQQDKGGVGGDASVLLSPHLIDYQAVADSQNNITLWHGTSDGMVPYASAEWLANEALRNATLNKVPDGTHDGCNFLLHSSIVDSVKVLGRSGSR